MSHSYCLQVQSNLPNGGGKSAPQFRNVEIIRYRYLLYKHPYMGPTKSTYHPLPPPTSPSNPSASSPSYDALKASFYHSAEIWINRK